MLLYAWQRDLGDKYPKIREAYQALKERNIVTEDPVVPNESESDRVIHSHLISTFLISSNTFRRWQIGLISSKAVATRM